MELKQEEVISKTVKVSNVDENDRKFTVAAHVEVASGEFSRLTSGVVKELPDESGYAGQLAMFSVNDGNALHVECYGSQMQPAKIKDILTTVADFISAAAAHVQTV